MSEIEAADPTYGSDKAGLVWGYEFGPDSSCRSINADEALALVSSGVLDREERFLWLHFSLANASAVRWMRQHLNLPDEFYQTFQAGVGSTRLEQEGNALLAVIHDVLFSATFEATDVSTVSLCIQPRLLVSARPRPLRSIDRLRASVRAGEKFRSTAELLSHLLREQAGVLVEIVRLSTSHVDSVEDKLLANRISSSRSELGALRRVLVRLQRLLAPEPAALFRLLSRPPDWIIEEDLLDLRQSAEEFNSAVADSAALVERIRLLQEELAALINEQNNKILFILTVFTVLALPFNIVGGLFGMNVGGIPFARDGHGFWSVITLVTLVTGVAAYIVVQKRRG